MFPNRCQLSPRAEHLPRQSILRRRWMPGSSPGMTSMPPSTSRTKTCIRVLATDFARALSLVVPPKQREQGMPGVWLARSLVRRKESTRVSHHRFAETIRHSLRDGFTTYSALSPAIGLSCHRRPARCEASSPNLTPASRRQDHAASSSADKRIRRLRHLRPSPPASNVRDDRETPLLMGAGCAATCF